MSPYIRYEVCPECGHANPESKGTCPVCDNKLSSDTEVEHQRYVELVRVEHRKRSLRWLGGWSFMALVLAGPLLLVATGKIGWTPGVAAMVGSMVIGWRLIDLQKKRQGSLCFLSRYDRPNHPTEPTSPSDTSVAGHQ